MEFFPATLTEAQSQALIERAEQHFDDHAYSLWAVESKADHELLGFTGLITVSEQLPMAPATEIGWRFKRSAWGQGLAYEAARAALDYGFEVAGLTEIVSFTARINHRSIALMQRLEMAEAGEFEHPLLQPDDPLRLHVLYRMTRQIPPRK